MSACTAPSLRGCRLPMENHGEMYRMSLLLRSQIPGENHFCRKKTGGRKGAHREKGVHRGSWAALAMTWRRTDPGLVADALRSVPCG